MKKNRVFLFKVAMKYLGDTKLSEDAVHNAFVDIISKKEIINGMSDVDFKKWAVTIVKSKSIDINITGKISGGDITVGQNAINPEYFFPQVDFT